MTRYSVPVIPPKPDPFVVPGYEGMVNISVQADQIGLNQTPAALNMNLDDGGVPTKRTGFERVNAVSWGATPIRGMVEYTPPGIATKWVVAWGGKLYSVADDGVRTDLCTGTKSTITDAYTRFFIMNDKLYAHTGTDYVVYDGTNPVANVTDIAYIPTITLGREPTGGGTANEQLNYLSNWWTDSFSPNGTATNYTLSFTGLAADAVYGERDTTSGTVALVEGVDFTVNRTTGVVTFGAAPAAGTNTVRLTAKKANLMDATVITKAQAHEIYGGKNDTRVFFANGNIRYNSGLLDATYWPEDGFVYIGTDAEDIPAFGKMIDYLINFKEKSITYTTVDVDETGEVIFPVYPLNDEYGLMAPRTVRPAQGGLLFFAQNNEGSPAGVGWLSPSLVRGQLNVRIVSENINRNRNGGTLSGLLDEARSDLVKAHAYIYDDKYWLHVGNKVWILDLAYSDFSQGVFCWYPYNGTPGLAGCFLERTDGQLYIGGNNQGVIYNTHSLFKDDGEIIDAYWTSPLVFVGGRDMIKKFDRLNITFKGQPEGSHTLTIITDQGQEDAELIYQAETVFDYSELDYSAWTYGVPIYPYPQSEKVGYKGTYLQWRIRNNTIDQGMTILNQSLRWFLIKEVK